MRTLTTGEDGFAALAVALMAYGSARTGRSAVAALRGGAG